jgi:hypothetical protein
MSKPRSSFDSVKDIIAGMVTGFAVSPTNAILDRSVIEYANGKQTVKEGVKSGIMRLVASPLDFITSYKFRWMYFVYLMTYTVNNLTDHSSIIPEVPIPLQNLMMTFSINTFCGILKDKAYIQHFGASQAKVFPATTLALLFFRDIITVASAFTLPQIFAKSLESKLGVSERGSLTIAQLASPLLVQVIVTPLHLFGLDIYNREGKKFGDRVKYLKGLYSNTLGMRMVRFMPAYGIGGIINNELRKSMKS